MTAMATGFVLHGIDLNSAAGISVGGAGDVNGDGFDEVIVGAYNAAYRGSGAGESFVVFGSPHHVAPHLRLQLLDGSNGFRIMGADQGDASGISVAGAGDVNGDGFDDVIVGAFNADPYGTNAGAAYVVFGTGSGFARLVDLAGLDGSNGFRMAATGAAFGNIGYAVSGAGDVNGDGLADVVVGARASGGTAGATFVVFGSTAGFDAALDVSTLDGSNGFLINGAARGSWSGFSVSSAGDINGDGVGDLIIGAPYAAADGVAEAGQTFVVFGSATGFPASLDLSSLDGSKGFRIDGAAAGDESGSCVSAAGDVNGDGIDDLVIGVRDADPNGIEAAGTACVVFGSREPFPADIDLADLDGTNGFRIDGVFGQSFWGHMAVAGAGDVNGDGFDDVILGTMNANGHGEAYLVFGSDTAFPASLTGFDLDGSNGYRFRGAALGERAGSAVAAAGDVNGDGYDDVVIGAWGLKWRENYNVGGSFIVFGGEARLATLDRLDGTDGIIDLADVGAFVGDDDDDEIVGPAAATSIYGFGGSDLLSGRGHADTVRGGDGDDTVYGRGGADLVSGDEGDDLLRGGRADDVLDGGTGNDFLLGGDGDDTVSSGRGNDELRGGTGADRLDGGKGSDVLRGQFGSDTMAGGYGNDRLVGGLGDDDLQGDAGRDLLVGGDGDDALLGGSADDILNGGEGNDTLDGGDGSDRYVGGTGADTFVLRSNEVSGDRIAFFSAADGDRIEVHVAPGGSVTEIVSGGVPTGWFEITDGSFVAAFSAMGATPEAIDLVFV
jgi:Ca2+-binding RTX toxin-like protein